MEVGTPVWVRDKEEAWVGGVVSRASDDPEQEGLTEGYPRVYVDLAHGGESSGASSAAAAAAVGASLKGDGEDGAEAYTSFDVPPGGEVDDLKIRNLGLVGARKLKKGQAAAAAQARARARTGSGGSEAADLRRDDEAAFMEIGRAHV